MTYTLSDCIESINQILNYPSVSYTDISIYFDQAISELNTELHLGLRPISALYKESQTDTDDLQPLIILDSRPILSNPLPSESEGAKVYFDGTNVYYFDLNTNAYKPVEIVYGVYTYMEPDSEGVDRIRRELYRTVTIGGNAYWTYYEKSIERDVDLLEYLPYDWIVLFLIPYVCFKYAVRDGDSGKAYAEDFANGMQQLRNAYSVPCKVLLFSVADRKAYRTDAKTNLSNLNTYVPTRAIYESMRVPNVIRAEYGGFYDKGGWII